jgi:hypothetical protein
MLAGTRADFGESDVASDRAAAAAPLLRLLGNTATRTCRAATTPHRLSTPHRFSHAATSPATPLLPGIAAVRAVGRTAAATPPVHDGNTAAQPSPVDERQEQLHEHGGTL